MRMKRNLKAIPVLVAGLFTSQLSIAAGSVSADPHAGHGMSAMQMPADENFTEMTSMEPIVTESRTPIPPVTDADRKAAFGNLQGHAIHDSAINYLVLLDQLEWQRSDNTNNFSWSVNSWIGGDTDRIWLKSEGSAVTLGTCGWPMVGFGCGCQAGFQTCFCPDLGCCRFSGAGTL